MNFVLGVSATLLRDIPYAAIYFPAYAHLKQYFTKEDGHLSLGWTLVAGFLAAIPSVGLTAPADLIKTRLQVKTQLILVTILKLFYFRQSRWQIKWRTKDCSTRHRGLRRKKDLRLCGKVISL